MAIWDQLALRHVAACVYVPDINGWQFKRKTTWSVIEKCHTITDLRNIFIVAQFFKTMLTDAALSVTLASLTLYVHTSFQSHVSSFGAAWQFLPRIPVPHYAANSVITAFSVITLSRNHFPYTKRLVSSPLVLWFTLPHRHRNLLYLSLLQLQSLFLFFAVISKKSVLKITFCFF